MIIALAKYIRAELQDRSAGSVEPFPRFNPAAADVPSEH